MGSSTIFRCNLPRPESWPRVSFWRSSSTSNASSVLASSWNRQGKAVLRRLLLMPGFVGLVLVKLSVFPFFWSEFKAAVSAELSFILAENPSRPAGGRNLGLACSANKYVTLRKY